MEWRELIADFNGLITALSQRLSKHKLAELLSKDKKTISAWLQGSIPANPMDVAWVIRHALIHGVDLSQFQTYVPIYDLSSMLTYDQGIQKGPIDLSWLTNAQRPPCVKTEFCGIELDGPLGVASSPLIADDKWANLMLNLGFGLSTFKTKRSAGKQAWLPPHIAFALEKPDTTKFDPQNPPDVVVTFNRKDVRELIPNLVNSIGVPSENSSEWQETYERIQRHPFGRFVGVSVIGDGDSRQQILKDFAIAVEKGRDVCPPFIELNLSCPNLGKTSDVYIDPDWIAELCTRSRQILKGTNTLLLAKIPALPDGMLEQILKKAGKYIDAVAFRNTIKVRPLIKDRDNKIHQAFPGREFAGLSGPATFESTRKGIQVLRKIKQRLGYDFRIIGIGGVSTAGHVVELLDAGASIVQACTAPIFDPLLAWKVRFHLKQSEHNVPTDPALPLLQPRNQAEIDSLRNAFEAYGEIQRRSPERAVPYHVFQEKWNHWMEQRPTAPIGRAHRISAPRTYPEWIRDFTS